MLGEPWFQEYNAQQGDIPDGSKVHVKWNDEEELYLAVVTGRRISVTYQVMFISNLCLHMGKKLNAVLMEYVDNCGKGNHKGDIINVDDNDNLNRLDGGDDHDVKDDLDRLDDGDDQDGGQDHDRDGDVDDPDSVGDLNRFCDGDSRMLLIIMIGLVMLMISIG